MKISLEASDEGYLGDTFWTVSIVLLILASHNVSEFGFTSVIMSKQKHYEMKPTLFGPLEFPMTGEQPASEISYVFN